MFLNHLHIIEATSLLKREFSTQGLLFFKENLLIEKSIDLTLDSISTLAKSSHLSEKRSRLDTKEGARSFCQKAPLGGRGKVSPPQQMS